MAQPKLTQLDPHAESTETAFPAALAHWQLMGLKLEGSRFFTDGTSLMADGNDGDSYVWDPATQLWDQM